MHRMIPLMTIAALAAALTAGCEPGDAVSTGPAGSASALVEATDEPEEAAPQTEELEDESMPAPLAVTWTDAADSAPTAALSFSVTNASEIEQSFTVAVAIRSLVGEARTALGERSLAPRESTEFSIDAEELPVRSAAVVGQAFVELTRETAQSDGAIVSSELLAGRFVRHEHGYGSVRTFTDETFQSELGGTLWSTATAAEDLATEKAIAAFESAPLGDVADGEGGHAVVKQGEAASNLLVRNDDGIIVGVLTSVREVALSPEAAAKAAEMEVSHE